MLQENSPAATCMSIAYEYAPDILLEVLAVYLRVSKFVSTELSFLTRMTNVHGHWVCRTSMGGKKLLDKNTHTAA